MQLAYKHLPSVERNLTTCQRYWPGSNERSRQRDYQGIEEQLIESGFVNRIVDAQEFFEGEQQFLKERQEKLIPDNFN